MKKKQLIKQLSKIEKKLDSYFNGKENKYILEVYDGDSRQYVEGYHNYKSQGYTGVTLNYIRTYLFNNKVSKDIIIYGLMNMLKNKKLKTLHCGNIQEIVFESKFSDHSSNSYEHIARVNPYECGYSRPKYIYEYFKYFKTHIIIDSYIN